MKASVFTWEYPPAIYGGAGVHAKYITMALAKRIKVEVRTLEVGPPPEIEGVNVLRYQSTLRGLATGDPGTPSCCRRGPGGDPASTDPPPRVPAGLLRSAASPTRRSQDGVRRTEPASRP